MKNEIIKKRLLLDLEIKDLLKTMNIIDNKKTEYSDYKVSNLSEDEFLDIEKKLISEVKNRLTNLFKD